MPTDGLLTRRELKAAYWAGRILNAAALSREDIRASYGTLPLGGQLDFDDLASAQELLETLGLVVVAGEKLAQTTELAAICQLDEDTALQPLLAVVLEIAPPLWLTAATGGANLRIDLIPEQAEAALSGVFADPASREAFLLARGRKVEADERVAIGNLGEEAVVEAARAELAALEQPALVSRVRQVSTISDELGYDVTAPRLDGTVRRMEVKTTRLAGSAITIFLSRNEAAVGAADPLWSLVVCELNATGGATVVGWIPAASVRPALPINPHPDGAWESARVRIQASTLTAGLPPV